MAEREEVDSMKNLKLKLRICKTRVTKLMNKIKDKEISRLMKYPWNYVICG